MNSWTELFNFFIFGGSLFLSVMGLWFTVVIPGIDRWSRRFFMSYFIIFLLSCLSCIIEMTVRYFVSDGVFFFLLILETFLISLPLPMMTLYLLHICQEDTRSSKLIRIVLGMWGTFFVMLTGSLFIEGFVYVTPDNQYYRGSLYPLLQMPIITVLLFNLAGTVRRRSRMSRKTFLSFVIAQAPMLVLLVVNVFVDVLPFFEISYVLSVLSMYGLVLSDQLEQDRRRQQEIVQQEREIARQEREIARQQREIAHERASVMVLQMRPHFIYNTLMSIYSLCRVDPPKARQITMDFTNYLRSNFNAIASDSTIPFSKELEHTHAYLAVEQAQYDDMLVVDYDTTFTLFRLPPLTLQPLVENAIKHGMDLDADPLHISIRTRHTDLGTEIIVEDNGRGFVDPSENDSEPGIALKNIRQRLELMCAGNLTITAGESGGTVARVTIPDGSSGIIGDRFRWSYDERDARNRFR